MEFNGKLIVKKLIESYSSVCVRPALAHFNRDLIIHTDACGGSLGAELSLVGEDDKRHVIAYASRLSSGEILYFRKKYRISVCGYKLSCGTR